MTIASTTAVSGLNVAALRLDVAAGATGNANRDQRTISAFIAIRNTNLLLTAASHRRSQRKLAPKHGKRSHGSEQGNDSILQDVTRIGARFHSGVLEAALKESNSGTP
jgi:hypothetical protein